MENLHQSNAVEIRSSNLERSEVDEKGIKRESKCAAKISKRIGDVMKMGKGG